MEFLSDLASITNSTLRISTPLVFAAMAGIFAERSGVIDFSLEGKMLMAALWLQLVHISLAIHGLDY